MPNYNQTKKAGQINEWLRSNKVVIDNTYNCIPRITFTEEKIQCIGEEFNKATFNRVLEESLENPQEEFFLLNPENNEAIGKAKYLDVYVMLYSLYMKLAGEDDARQV